MPKCVVSLRLCLMSEADVVILGKGNQFLGNFETGVSVSLNQPQTFVYARDIGVG